MLVALLRVLWRLSYQDRIDWLQSWPALALACGFAYDSQNKLRVPSPSQQCKRRHAAGAPLFESLFLVSVRIAVRRRVIRAHDLIIDSAPILAWRRSDPDATYGHAPAHHPRPLLRGFRVQTLICRGSGLPLQFLVSPANVHDSPFARPLLEMAVYIDRIRPRSIRLDAAYWGLLLIRWIHETLGAVAVIPWNPKRQKNRSCFPPSWTKEELGKRSSIERFFDRVFLFFRRERSSFTWMVGWYRPSCFHLYCLHCVALAAWNAQRPDLIRSPQRVLAHLWESGEL